MTGNFTPNLFAVLSEPSGQLSIRSGQRVFIITVHWQETALRTGAHVW